MLKTFLSFTLLLSIGGAVSAQKAKQNNKTSSKSEVKFLENVQIEITPSSVEQRSQLSELEQQYFSKKDNTVSSNSNTLSKIETVSKVQIKYALLLDTEVEQIQNVNLYTGIDEWLGTRYRLGGASKSGIDCSALIQILYVTQYGISLPRTAREQYDATERISRTNLKEGDLVFFNTQGGVSHVGIYLQNNKFVHASTSGGVMISDIFDEYWAKKFVGVGRLKDRESVVSTK